MKHLHKFLCAVLAAILMGTTFLEMIVPIRAATPVYTVSTAYKNSVYYDNLGKIQLTGVARDDLVRVALSQVGYHEGNSTADFDGGNRSGSKNYVEFNRLHGTVYDSSLKTETYGYYWCASFATWCAAQAGISSSVVPVGGTAISTERLRSWFMTNATYKTRGSYTPLTGDYVFFCDDAGRNTTHVGLVLYVKNGTLYTVEGNAGSYDAVALKSYALTSTYIVGYGIPRYTTGTKANFDPSDKTGGGLYIVTAASLALRSGPGTGYAQLDSLPISTTLTVTEVSGNWGKVSYNGKAGWMSLNYAMPLSTSDLTIVYDANGGTGAPAAQCKTRGVNIALRTTVPEREGYNFLGWSTSQTATKALYAPGGVYTADESLYLYAVWERKTVKVRFCQYDGTLLTEKTYYWGDNVLPPANPSRKADKTFTYTFSGWSPTPGEALKDTSYTAVYDAKYIEYTVTFRDADGTLLTSGKYHYGDTIQNIPSPTKAADNVYSYTFIGWGETVRRVEGDKVYTAVYDKNYLNYEIIFEDDAGNVLSCKTYHYGEAVVPPQAPVKPSDELFDYVFLGWDRGVSQVTGHTVYRAVYARNDRMYTIRFTDAQGKVVAEYLCRYGETVTPPPAPEKAADASYRYEFAGWSADIVPVKGDATYSATYTPHYVDYAVTFVDETGHIYMSSLYHYGDALDMPETPVKLSSDGYEYEFAGWTPAVTTPVEGDAVYVAKFRQTRTDKNGLDFSDGMNTGLIFLITFVVLLFIGGGVFAVYWKTKGKWHD